MNEFKKYFNIKELVCNHVLQKYNEEQIWSFFDPRLLETIYAIRKELCRKIKINNGSQFTQRGLRCNCCKLVSSKLDRVYMTAHLRGQALDFDVEGMTAEVARQAIIAMADKLPHKIRLEAGVTWVHIDVATQPRQEQKVYLFNV